MILGIMQPYFFPYIGYFQLMSAVDEFVVYDNIKYTKKGWINRNRIQVDGTILPISIPLQKGSDSLEIFERNLSETWPKERVKLLNRIKAAYSRAPFFQDVFPLLEECILFEERNLFAFLFHSLNKTKEFLGIETPIVISSTTGADHSLKGEERVLAICRTRNASQYWNPIGGKVIYNRESFSQAGIPLYFLKSTIFPYPEFSSEFVPWLSIIDVMMFLSREDFPKQLRSFTLE